MKYAAYGVLYKNNKRVTKTPYRIDVGKTKKEAKTKAIRHCRSWNKIMVNKRGRWVSKFVSVKRVNK